MSDAPFVQAARAETGIRDQNNLRAAIRGRADHEEIERLWEKCERWTVRADLPPTLAQAMMVPEVREVVESAKALLEAHESGWIAGEDWGAAARARAALHRIGKTK